MNSILELHNISKSYIENTGHELILFRNVNLQIFAAEKIAIVGASGVGKSTLLNIASLLEEEYMGNLFVHGKMVSSYTRSVLANIRLLNFGFVYQDHSLLSDFNCYENVAIPLLIKNYTKAQSFKLAQKILSEVALETKCSLFPDQLSGGEKQRLSIARALISTPKVIFADEPTGNLDFKTAGLVEKFFFHIVEQYGSALVMVTHNLELAKKMDKVFLLENTLLKQIY